jgi:pSer/pThr/pTyr-binding forkhead associated (FHA) protein
MAVRLTIKNPADPDGELTRSFVQDRIVVGRARYCDVCLPDMNVSTRHAEIEVRGSDYVIVDQRSLNGTRVQGKQLVPLRPRVLKNGDLIGIAGFEIGFRLGVSPGPAEPRDEPMRQARELLLELLARSNATPAHKALLVIDGPGKASRFDLPQPPAVLQIGRSADADVKLADSDVSRRHAELELKGDGTITLRDLESRNGVVVDGERVAAIELEVARPFTLGNTILALEHPIDQPLAAIMEAPEEATSSFSPDPPPTDPEQSTREGDAAQAADAQTAKDEDEPDQPDEPPPIGPADPLAHPGQPGYVPTEREIPRPEIKGGSDIGLILVGAIIVVAAVVGLVLLFS